MLEKRFQSSYHKRFLEPILPKLTQVHPFLITAIGALIGLLIPFALSGHHSFFALILLILTGYCDTLDGALARTRGISSNKGAVYDITADRLVECAILFGLYLYDPSRATLVLLMTIASFLCVTTFLVTAIFTPSSGEKSFYYSPGIMERAEAFLFFALMILLPFLFTPLAILYIALVALTAFLRIK